jgi:Protein of unknown function, DUF481
MDAHALKTLKAWHALFACLLVAASIFTASTPLSGYPAPPTQDVVLFKNGDRLSGKLVEATHDGVTFAGAPTGTLSLQWNVIQRISLSQSSLALTSKANSSSAAPNKFTVNLDAIDVHESDLVLTQAGTGPSLTVSIVDFVSLNAPPPSAAAPRVQAASILYGWRGMLQTQDSLIGATQKKYDVAGTLHLARPTRSRNAFSHQVTSINLQADFGESSKPKASPVRTVLYQGLLQQSIYLNDKGSTYLFGFSDFYHNLSLGMNFEQSYGMGVGWDGHHKRHGFGFAGDIRYVGEDVYAPGVSLKLAASGLSEYYTYTFSWPKKKPVSFSERILFIPTFNQSRAYQARGVAQLQLPLTPKFSIGLQEYDDYLRNAPKGTNQNYSKVSLTLKYSIGAPL